jgi:hypothetical protein
MSASISVRARSRIRVGGPAGAFSVVTPAPWKRAFLAASTAMAVGLLGHHLAGGAIDVTAMVVAFVPVLLLVRVQASRQLGWWAYTGMLLLAQVLVHVAATSCTPHGMNASPQMLLMHGCAAALAGLALHWHETRAWAASRGNAIRAWVRTLLGRIPANLPVPSLATDLVRDRLMPATPGTRVAPIPSRRGPPMLAHS